MRIWIIGGGKFGAKAAASLLEKYPEADILMVDSCAEALEAHVGRLSFIQADAVDYLVENLKDPKVPDWIVAAVPRHILYEWIRRTGFMQCDPMPVPRYLADVLPNTIRGPGGEIYVSHSAALCPEDCPEPEDICPATGRPREKDMYLVIENLEQEEFRTIVVRSRQLVPGTGGYSAQDLFKARKKAETQTGKTLICTACPCQAVIHAVNLETKGAGIEQ